MYSTRLVASEMKEEHVDPPEEGGLDGEEITGEHACRVSAQECAPRRAASLRGGLEAFFNEHLAHRRRGDDDAQTLEIRL